MRNIFLWVGLFSVLVVAFVAPSTVFAVAPAVVEFSPLDNAVGVGIDEGINNSYIIYFDQEIAVGTGNITLKKASDDSTIEVFDITDSNVIFFDTQDVYITGGVTLDYETDYYFLVDAGVVESVGGDPFAGIADETVWTFTTEAAPPPLALEFERVSVSSEGVEADALSSTPSISADGRYVTFESSATNLVAGDANADSDVFVYDRTNDTIERVSVSSEGVEADSGSGTPSISPDGRYVTFRSFATNLVAGDTNGAIDIFVYDRTLDTVERVSVSSEGVEADGLSTKPVISVNGRYVTFRSIATNLVAGDTNGMYDIFVYDRDTDTIERVSVSSEGVEADDESDDPTISSDGRYVTFESSATNLVAGDTNATIDIFVYDRDTDTIERVSVSSEGVEADSSSNTPSISADGRYVAFASDATNLVAGDTNETSDIFVYDRDSDTIEKLGIVGGGLFFGNPSISGNGRYVAYIHNEEVGSGVYRYDTETDTVLNITEGAQNNTSATPKLSNIGLAVTFRSAATNLVDGDTNELADIFVYGEITPSEDPADSGDVIRGGGDGSNNLGRTSSDLEDPDLDSPDSLQEKINALIAQINALRARLGLPPLGGSPQAGQVSAFPRNLTLGSVGPDVKALQIYLNTHGFILAPSGPGSPGNETNLFGPLTKNALAKFQASVGISPASGYFGPITRAYVNAHP